jgi:hypothetical protein
VATACTQGKRQQHGKPRGVVGDDQPDSGDGKAGRHGVADGPVVPMRPGNAGGGKGPWFKTDATSGEGHWRLGNLSTPSRVRELRKALHAEVKVEAGYRLCAAKGARRELDESALTPRGRKAARLRWWLRGKYKVRRHGYLVYPPEYVHGQCT